MWLNASQTTESKSSATMNIYGRNINIYWGSANFIYRIVDTLLKNAIITKIWSLEQMTLTFI